MATPAEILCNYSINQSLVTGWETKFGFMPDPIASKTKCLAFYDYGSQNNGKLMAGVQLLRGLVQLRIRGSYTESYDKLIALNNIYILPKRPSNITVVLNSITYRIDSFSFRSGPLLLGTVKDSSFNEFTLNGSLLVTQL